MKVLGVLLLALAAPFANVMEAQAIAPAKVGIVNAQKAVADTQEIKKAQATLEAKYRPRQQAIAQLQNDLQSIQQQLTAPNLTPDREAQLRQTGADKQKQLQRANEDLQSDVNAERQDILGRAGRQMSEIIRKLAEQRGLDVIVDVTNTLYYKPALDLTAEATADYDKAYPAK
ncbi:MAG TPA: OmpH family outer membrane protein [Bryobacteraceae bacterium]|jgi:outer membrane protein|nr:OmpH family outer membrane protein [Bryobacteraceae bacterium]